MIFSIVANFLLGILLGLAEVCALRAPSYFGDVLLNASINLYWNVSSLVVLLAGRCGVFRRLLSGNAGWPSNETVLPKNVRKAILV